MTDKDVLTQEEIDALLSGVGDEELGVDDSDPDKVVSAYDLTKQDRVVGGRLPTVELISERFARLLRVSLPACLKVPLEIGQGGVQVVKFGEYLETLYVPTCIRLLKIQPFSGTCMLALDAKLIHKLVDRFFGGKGGASTFEGREFSPTENRVISRIVEVILRDMTSAWREVLPIRCEIVGEEVNPALLNVTAPGEAVLVNSYRIELDGAGGELHLLLPYEALEPFRRVLDASSQKDDEGAIGNWQAAMQAALLETELELSCLIGDSQVRLRDIVMMQPGTVLDLDMNEMHQVSVAKHPIFTASLGDSRGKFALEFERYGKT